MFEGWQARWRRRWIERLRPGRDEEELLAVLDRAEAIRSEEHRRMLRNLVVFRDTRVRELMIPRSEVLALEVSTGLDAAARQLADAGFSKVPVFEESLDRIVGMVQAWDVFASVVRGRQASLRELLRPCLRVPESQLVLGLLLHMKEQGAHLAVVVDEYGGTAGLVTLADLLTEIVGSLDAEDRSAEDDGAVPDGEGWLVSGRMHVEDLAQLVGRPLPGGDFDTVGGLVTSLCGRIPAPGEQLEVAGLRVKVLEADPRRLVRLRIEVAPGSVASRAD